MSLVDYASSSDDDDDDLPEKLATEQAPEPQVQGPQPNPSPLPPPSSKQMHGLSSNQLQGSAPPPSTYEKLPDASLLLNSTSISAVRGSDHASWVRPVGTETTSRKRDSTGLPSSSTHSKLPKGSLLHGTNVPDTASGVLVPPQLRGRSNVVTEDIGKLFVKGPAASLSR
ncbi:hypothetical protein LINGRAHAP2_LOCUS30163 [Linum grandiflorum]